MGEFSSDKQLLDLVDEWDRTRAASSNTSPLPTLRADENRTALSASTAHAVPLDDLPADVLGLVAAQLVINNGTVQRRHSLHNQTDGLKAVARLGLACRRLKTVHDALMVTRPDLAQQAAEQSHVMVEKHRLVRRLTLDHHSSVVHKEVAMEVAGGSVLVTALLAMCSSSHSWCTNHQLALHAVAVAIVHTVMHNLLLRVAYRSSARFGILRTLLVGLFASTCVCLLLPLWPVEGSIVQARLIPVLCLMFSWAYGAWEYRAAHTYLKIFNGLT